MEKGKHGLGARVHLYFVFDGFLPNVRIPLQLQLCLVYQLRDHIVHTAGGWIIYPFLAIALLLRISIGHQSYRKHRSAHTLKCSPPVMKFRQSIKSKLLKLREFVLPV